MGWKESHLSSEVWRKWELMVVAKHGGLKAGSELLWHCIHEEADSTSPLVWGLSFGGSLIIDGIKLKGYCMASMTTSENRMSLSLALFLGNLHLVTHITRKYTPQGMSCTVKRSNSASWSLSADSQMLTLPSNSSPQPPLSPVDANRTEMC